MDAETNRCRIVTLLGCVLAFIALLPGCREKLEDYVSEEGRFRIRMPGQPRPARPGELPKGKHKVSYEQRSGNYTVAWEDLPAKDDLSAEERLDLACNGAIDELKGKALSRMPITHQGHPGRELIVEWASGKGIVHDRMYLIGNRLYHVMAAGEKWWVESSTSQRVLDSFEIIEE